MATLYVSNNPPIKNSAYTFPVVLFSQADTKLIKASPTLATGDVKVGYEEQEPTANIASLPSSTLSGQLEVSLSAAEMNHNRVMVKFSDASGAEWCDLLVTFSTVTAVTVSGTDAPNAATIAGAVLDEPVGEHTGLIATNLNATVDSRLATTGYTVPPTAAAIATAVWSAVTRTLTAGSSSAADVWAYATRTLTQTAAAVTAAVSGSVITVQRGDTFSATLTGLAANTGFVSIDFTIKTNRAETDAESIVCIRKNASGLTDGLLYLNGATAATPAQGSITVVSSTSITITLAAAATDDLTPASGLQYDVQYIMASSVTTATEGVCNITADVRRAIA